MAQVHTTGLRVKETTSAVGGHAELTAPGEARLKGAALTCVLSKDLSLVGHWPCRWQVGWVNTLVNFRGKSVFQTYIDLTQAHTLKGLGASNALLPI